LTRDGPIAVWKRRLHGLGEQPEERAPSAERLAKAPIILVAVDVTQRSEALSSALRLAAKRALHTEPGARLACVTVMKTHRIAMDVTMDDEGRSIHVKRLVELKHWARPLGVPPARITYHVLSSPDAASAIVEFAAANHVDQIVIGSR